MDNTVSILFPVELGFIYVEKVWKVERGLEHRRVDERQAVTLLSVLWSHVQRIG